MLGLYLRTRLPKLGEDGDSKDVLRLVMGLVATISALVLGLLISSAHSSYSAQDGEVKQLAVHLFQLDRILGHLGPEAQESRKLLREIVLADVERTWATGGVGSTVYDTLQAQREAELLLEAVASIVPASELQKFGKGRALSILAAMGETRRLMDEQARSTLSWPFVVVLVFWLTVLFVGFGLFARVNATVVTALLVGALSVSGAIFLIGEMHRPYTGIMQISNVPISNALSQMGK